MNYLIVTNDGVSSATLPSNPSFDDMCLAYAETRVAQRYVESMLQDLRQGITTTPTPTQTTPEQMSLPLDSTQVVKAKPSAKRRKPKVTVNALLTRDPKLAALVKPSRLSDFSLIARMAQFVIPLRHDANTVTMTMSLSVYDYLSTKIAYQSVEKCGSYRRVTISRRNITHLLTNAITMAKELRDMANSEHGTNKNHVYGIAKGLVRAIFESATAMNMNVTSIYKVEST